MVIQDISSLSIILIWNVESLGSRKFHLFKYTTNLRRENHMNKWWGIRGDPENWEKPFCRSESSSLHVQCMIHDLSTFKSHTSTHICKPCAFYISVRDPLLSVNQYVHGAHALRNPPDKSNFFARVWQNSTWPTICAAALERQCDLYSDVAKAWAHLPAPIIFLEEPKLWIPARRNTLLILASPRPHPTLRTYSRGTMYSYIQKSPWTILNRCVWMASI